MKTLTLKRISDSDKGSFGVLLDGDIPFAVTLELPWRDNQSNISCIPVGMYHCKRVNSPKFGDTFEITGVPGRSNVLFHKGNRIEDTHGCVLVAEEFGKLGDDTVAVLQSGHGYMEMMEMMRGIDEFSLEIMGV